MLRFFLLIFFPILLSANLIYTSNYTKEIAVLESFDIEASFLYDPVMNDMRNSNFALAKEQRFFQAMDEAYIFIPAIKSILAKYSLPPEFLFLAMAESNFSTRAYSNKKAAGFWQFMPETGRLYGLKIDEYIDERRDFIKSTEAAAKFLSNLHKKFGKWYLAAIAYNCGGGRVAQAIQEAGSDELSVLLDPEKKYLPKESKLYIRKIVELALMGNDEQFLLDSESEYLLNRANTYSTSTISLPGGESLLRVSELIGIPVDELKKLNRHLKYDFIPPYANGYSIHIPYIKFSEFKEKYFEEDIQDRYKIHIVKNRENLLKISKMYNISQSMIIDFNKLKDSKLENQQKLIIPIENSSKETQINSNFYYMVKKGDTLDSISRDNQISVQVLKLHNTFKNNSVKVGERIRLYE